MIIGVVGRVNWVTTLHQPYPFSAAPRRVSLSLWIYRGGKVAEVDLFGHSSETHHRSGFRQFGDAFRQCKLVKKCPEGIFACDGEVLTYSSLTISAAIIKRQVTPSPSDARRSRWCKKKRWNNMLPLCQFSRESVICTFVERRRMKSRVFYWPGRQGDSSSIP